MGRNNTRSASGKCGKAAVTGEELPPHKIPLLGRLYGDAASQSAQGNKFYDICTSDDPIWAKHTVDINKAIAEGLPRNADELRRGIVRELTGSESLRDTAALSNVRHIALIEQARAST